MLLTEEEFKSTFPKDGTYRHVTFITEVKNIHYIVVLDLKNKKNRRSFCIGLK